jgi:glycolate oxidase
MDKRIIKKIEKIVGKDNISFKQEDLICYSYDASNRKYLPDLVVHPASTEEISAVLKLANRENIHVVPRGAGCGFSGGAVPIKGGVVLVLTRLNRILEIDIDNLIAVVEPGVVTKKLQTEVEKIGLFYPPDPASLEYCTLGGNIAECAGGPRAFKYGVTREYILGLEVVLPTGEIINTGSRVMKNVVGYDLTRLIIGSEGTLGIATKIIIKLIPLPPNRRILQAIFSKSEHATQAVASIIKNRIIPSTIEFMDQASINAVEDYLQIGLPRHIQALLVIEIDGNAHQVEEDSYRIEDICLKLGAEKVVIAKDEKEEEEIWKVRRSVSPAIARVRNTKINEDIVVPRSKIPELISYAQELSKTLDVIIICFGHAGDGNIHVNFMYNKEDEEESKRTHVAVDKLFDKVLALEGSISGEHGIGFMKSPYLTRELSPQTIEIMKRIKKAFDPNNILNPGKIFPD